MDGLQLSHETVSVNEDTYIVRVFTANYFLCSFKRLITIAETNEEDRNLKKKKTHPSVITKDGDFGYTKERS